VTAPRSGARRTLAELSVPSESGNERRAMEEVAAAVGRLGLPGPTLERLKTAVAEATMNAMEHGNHYHAELPVIIEVSASDAELSVKITDEGSGPAAFDSEVPDLELGEAVIDLSGEINSFAQEALDAA
jgi:anti-sigma regulatory factor (Ser/Thr protein kinase)